PPGPAPWTMLWRRAVCGGRKRRRWRGGCARSAPRRARVGGRLPAEFLDAVPLVVGQQTARRPRGGGRQRAQRRDALHRRRMRAQIPRYDVATAALARQELLEERDHARGIDARLLQQPDPVAVGLAL